MNARPQFFSQHALEQARARYGLTLSSNDMLDILRACKDGRAQVMRVTEKGRVYSFRFHGIWIFPVMAKVDDAIVTFMPVDFIISSTAKEHRVKTGGRHKRRFGPPDGPQGYRRQRKHINIDEDI